MRLRFALRSPPPRLLRTIPSRSQCRRKEFVARPGIRLSFASTSYRLRCAMIETGLVYIYSISPARNFKGCGTLLDGGYVATCRHVWRIAAPDGQPSSNELPEVEIEFP